jgi:hypothetical protein
MSFDKTVKNACKPKKDVPKAKVRPLQPLSTSSVFLLVLLYADLVLALILLLFFLYLVGTFSPSSSPPSFTSNDLYHTKPHHTVLCTVMEW